MEREIEYRAVDLSGNLINNIGRIEFFVDGQIMVNEDIPVKTLLQFTGVKDKKGNKIFEGDIIRATETGYDDIVSAIEYTKGVILVTQTKVLLWDYPSSELEVIGNIYENIELLAITQKPL